MTGRLPIVLLVVALVGARAASGQPTLAAETWRSSAEVRDGLVHTEFGAAGDSVFAAWSAHLLTVDLDRFRLDVVLAMEQVTGQETTSSVVSRSGALAGVNGGFSISNDAWNIIHGDPNGFLVVDGRVLSEPVADRPALGLCGAGGVQRFRVVRPRLDVVLEPGAAAGSLPGLNRARDADDLVVYTPEWGRSTLTWPGGLELVVRDGRVVATRSDGSAMIPDDGFVLSASGSRMDEIASRYGMGSSLDYRLDVSDAGGDPVDVSGCDFTGAGPLIASGGIVRTDFGGEAFREGFIADRHPRTAVGWSTDGRTAYLFVIDGRQDHSAGATLEELAALVVGEGAETVYNLDGGGSTTMALEGGRVVNSPSDGPERRRCDVVVVTPRMR